MFDLAIIGGGPAGVSAGVYASRKQLKTIFLTDSWGGQSIVSESIENWIGTPTIAGIKLAEDLKIHLKTYAGDIVEIHEGTWVKKVSKKDDHFVIETNGNSYEAKTVLIATGSTRRKLEIPGADTFEHKGITYCASCDGPLFSGQDVAVIGGGNAAFESAAQLLAYCKSVTILNRSDEFRADPITVEKVLSHPNMRVLKNVDIAEVKGDAFAHTLVYKDRSTHESHDLAVTGIFVEIGLLPSTDYVADVVELNQYKQIVTDPRTQQTKTKGIWAAGDCTDTLYHQNNIAAGDAVRALEDIYSTLKTK